MKLLKFLLSLPVVLSAASIPSNPFNRFHEYNSVKIFFLDFLNLKEQVKFLTSCRTLYRLLEAECEKVFEIVSTSENLLPEHSDSTERSYSTASASLKYDILRLLKYYEFETRHDSYHKPLSLELFYEFIRVQFHGQKSVSSFFKDLFACETITKDNTRFFKRFYPIFSPPHSIQITSIPNFPEILLLQLKVQKDHSKLAILIENALVSPYLFEEFFKYLTVEVLKITQNELVQKLNKEFTFLQIAFDPILAHFVFLQNAFVFNCSEYIVAIAFTCHLIQVYIDSISDLLVHEAFCFVLGLVINIVLYNFIYLKYNSFHVINVAYAQRFCFLNWVLDYFFGILGPNY